MQSSETDHDGDGAADYRSNAINGVIYREEWLDPHQNIVKRITYKNGRADNGEIDSDGDGKLDSRRFYNRIAEVVRVEPMKP